MFPTHILKNCLNFFAQDKDHSYLSFVFDLYTKSLKQTDTVLTEILSNYLVEAFSKKSVPFNVLAKSQDVLEFFQTYQTHSLTPSEGVVLQKNKLKEQVMKLGFFNADTIIQIDSIFYQIMIDSFFEFSKLSTKTFNINTESSTTVNTIHTEFLTFFNDQDIINHFIDKSNGFYLVRKSIDDPIIYHGYCHAIVMKSNSKINIFDISFEKIHTNTMGVNRKYQFKDFVGQNYDYIKQLSSQSNALSVNNVQNTIFKIKDYNLLIIINLIFMIQNQYELLLINSTFINNYHVADQSNNLPALINLLPIADITLDDVKFDSDLINLNSIENIFIQELKEKIEYINFKPKDFSYKSIYNIKPFNRLEERKNSYTHFEVKKYDYEYALSYVLKLDFLPLQQLGSISNNDYSKYLKLYGQFNKISLLQEYFAFHFQNHYSEALGFIQSIISENWEFFVQHRHLLKEEKIINTKINEYNNLSGSKIIVSDQPDFINNKKIKAANKNVFANEFFVYSLTTDFIKLIENNFNIPEKFKLFFLSYHQNQHMEQLGIKYEVKRNFDIHNMNILSLCYFNTFDFNVLIPWKS